MQVQGIVIAAMQEQSGVSQKGNPWSRRDYVIETMDQYPKKVAFSLMNDKIGQFNPILAVGANVIVDFDIDSREYNGRWYVSLTAWKVTTGDKQASQQAYQQASQQAHQPQYAQQAPYGNQPQQYANPYGQYQRPASKPVPDVFTRDLPFK